MNTPGRRRHGKQGRQLPVLQGTRGAGKSSRGRRWLVVLLAVAGMAAFAAAYFQPWWDFALYAPQYPRGLRLTLWLTQVTGDVREVNMLNHYIGMGNLDDAAKLEREIAIYAVAALCMVVLALVLLSGRRLAKSLMVAGVAFPVLFIADSFYWLYRFGHELDPRAPVRIPPFTPEMFGNGSIGQFMTFAQPALGFWLAVSGAVLLAIATLLRERVCANCESALTCGKICPNAFLGRGSTRSAALHVAALIVPMLLVPSRAFAVPEQGVGSSTRALAAAGPESRVIPAGAVVARDAAALRRLLADPAGPREIWLERRVYHGPFVVSRAVTLRGSGSGTVIDGGGQGSVVSLSAPGSVLEDVTVQNSGRRNTSEDAAVRMTGDGSRAARLRVKNSLFGISVGPCKRCVVERVHVVGDGGHSQVAGDGIKLWEADDSVVRLSLVEQSRDVVVWYSRRVLLEHNQVRDGRYGTHFMYAHDSIVRDSKLTNNVVGIFVMYSARMRIENNVLAGARGAAGIGLGLKESDGVHVSRNWLVANTVGAYLDRSPVSRGTPVRFDANVVALNQVGLRLHGTERGAGFTGNDFRQNAVLAEVEGGGDALGLDFHDNFWSDYGGYDLNRDGVGDVPYQLKQLSSALKEDHPAVRIFEGTPAMLLIDAIAQAVPVLMSRLLLSDQTPSAQPHRSHE
jgi:nitrous oxidase accessory protein